MERLDGADLLEAASAEVRPAVGCRLALACIGEASQQGSSGVRCGQQGSWGPRQAEAILRGKLSQGVDEVGGPLPDLREMALALTHHQCREDCRKVCDGVIEVAGGWWLVGGFVGLCLGKDGATPVRREGHWEPSEVVQKQGPLAALGWIGRGPVHALWLGEFEQPREHHPCIGEVLVVVVLGNKGPRGREDNKI